jgi:2-polyprenyl-6-methoxyphenol hydroxylase-like FAD-dependent oxidoreductase
LRKLMLDKIDPQSIQWGKRFVKYEQDQGSLGVCFEGSSDQLLSALVGADGIFSRVRRQMLDTQCTYLSSSTRRPFDLNYLGLIVILGISPVKSSRDSSNNVLCQRQWLDGCTRVFTMPFDKERSMWQLSYPMTEQDALLASSMGGVGERSAELAGRKLKEEAMRRCASWDPALLSLIESTDDGLVSGHPVYDSNFDETGTLCGHPGSLVTLIGDAAHPMSPFKGQGANQALLDALHLSKAFASSTLVRPGRRSISEALRGFEHNMLQRVRPKVLKSREAAVDLHSDKALTVANITRASAAALNA